MDRYQMNLDDFYDYLDGEPEVTETVDAYLARLRGYKVVKLEVYRKAVQQYKSWKPVSLEEYAAKLLCTQKQLVERGLRKAREAANKRVIRQNKLKK